MGIFGDTVKVKKKKVQFGGARGGVRPSRNKNTINELQTSLKENPRFGKMVEYSCQCLRKLVVDETSAEDLISEGVIETLMDVLKKNPGNDKVTQAVMETFMAIGRTDELCDLMADRMGEDYQVFMDVLNKSEDNDVLAATSNIVHSLSKKPKRRDLLQKQGAVAALTDVVNRHDGKRSHIGATSAATRALWEFGKVTSSAKEIVDTKAVETLLRECKKHPDDETLHERTAQLIANMCSTGDKSVIEYLKQIGGVDFMMNALEKFPFNARIQAAAAVALAAMTGKNDMALAMQLAFGDTSKIDDASTKAMGKVACLMLVKENVSYFGKHDGVKLCLAKMKTAETECKDPKMKDQVLTYGARILGRHCLDPKKIYEILKQGGVEALIALLMKGKQSEPLTAASLNALGNMCCNKDNTVFIVKSGGMKAAVASLGHHSKCVPVIQSALKLMHAFGKHAKSAKIVGKKGGLAELLKVMKMNQANPAVIGPALKTLGGYTGLKDQDISNMLHDLDVVPLLQDLLKTHEADKDICADAVKCLNDMLINKGARALMKDCGLTDLIKQLMDMYNDDDLFNDLCQDLLGGIFEMDQMDEAALKALADAEAKAAADALAKQQEEQRRQEELEAAEMAAAFAKLQAETTAAERRAREEAALRDAEELERRKKEAESNRMEAMVKPAKPHKQLKVDPLAGRKKLRGMLEDEEKGPVPDLPPPVQDFLRAGSMLIKHSAHAPPRPRHVFMSNDLMWFCWKKAKKDLDPVKQRMSTWRVKEVYKGRCTPQLERKRLGKYLAQKEQCCLSVFGSDEADNLRTLDLEAPTEQVRDKWYRNIKRLIEWKDQKVAHGIVKVKKNVMHENKGLAAASCVESDDDSDDGAPPPPPDDDDDAPPPPPDSDDDAPPPPPS